jgi:hypothetical protein
MSAPYSSNSNHNSTVYALELARQNAVQAAAGNQTTINSAAITFHRGVVKSGLANNVGVEPSMTALRALGVSGL